ncbi:MAG: acyloxyacyl hydrolase [Armatimonadetes bacterium]|nr:acyloxyacyl hydrolase [Armatimonadota bacterium]
MKLVQIAAIALAALACGSASWSQDLRFDSFQRGQREYAVLAGYGVNHRIPEAAKDRFSFDILKFRYGVFTSPRTQLAFDLTAGNTEGQMDNSAFWATTSYRRYFIVRGSTAVGFDLNFGLLRMRNPVSELGTRTNFTEQIGLVLQHGVTPSTALTLEYKFSHISNGGIRLPNVGINASMVSLGYSWYR